jgi:two-component system, NtrC family, nitrogen regulation response regulator NtrX
MTGASLRPTTAVMRQTILVVDDEPGVRAALSGVLRDEGYLVDAVDSGEACLERVARASYDVIVLDVWLPGIDGLSRCSGCASARSTRRSS